jgi:chemotaxis protein CheY-P-specific phosphatase CheC
VGNIILSACLSAFGDMLKVAVTFSVPRIQIEVLDELLRSMVVESEELQYALIAATEFRLSDAEVGGYLIVAVGMSSLALISRALDERVA